MEYEFFYTGNDGLEHVETVEGGDADMKKRLTFLEERGAHQITVCCQGIEVLPVSAAPRM